jgi:hypothetical protein
VANSIVMGGLDEVNRGCCGCDGLLLAALRRSPVECACAFGELNRPVSRVLLGRRHLGA